MKQRIHLKGKIHTLEIVKGRRIIKRGKKKVKQELHRIKQVITPKEKGAAPKRYATLCCGNLKIGEKLERNPDCVNCRVLSIPASQRPGFASAAVFQALDKLQSRG